MNQKLNHRFILALAISLTLFACNNQGDKKDEAATTDSTAKAKTDSVQPAPKEAATDAVTVAPGLYKVLADTMGLRIVEATYKPGDSSAMHSHADYALYVIEGGTAAFYGKDGTKMDNVMKTGMENIRPAEFHSVKNIGKTTIKVLLVEVNRPQGTSSRDAATDPTKVAANLYKSMRDTLGIRILEATYKPGQESAMHSHPDAAVYAISGGTATFTGKDGTKLTNDLKTGMALFTPAGTHTVKNTGKTTMKILLVEVSRPAK
jgi:quercetin dioxygenase-like cupin family protein